MKNGLIKVLALSTLLCASINAQAGLLVEQYNGYWSNNVDLLKDYADNNAASASGVFDVIDFTDDPAGFAGDIAGSNRWPSAEAADANGTSHSLNNQFFAKITGDFTTSVAQDYFFQTWNDDGVFLYIDGLLTINDPNLHAERRFEGSQFLDVGTHSIELYFFENGGEASLEFTVADSSKNFMHIGDAQSPISLVSAAASVPEPSTLAIFALGVVGFAARRVNK
ncbi:PEP-CTERM sorting domain-containing protein [Thalassotalea sp. PLHSN55]|uniref:PEP-CTERM sorting domain-containing protein n=1 Tax=Thalassotalea sp. PLHSN55 TaxID=3435888 RepID=UPI003F834636